MKKTLWLCCILALLFAAVGAHAAMLPDEKITTCYPIVKGKSYAANAPVPFTAAFKGQQPQGELEIWFGRITVCDGFIVRCNGETMLIDGGNFKNGQATKLFLSKMGIENKVDYIFNTHHHDDHLEMQTFLMNHGFQAKEFLTPYPKNYPVAAQLNAQKAAKKAGIKYHTIQDGDTLYLGGKNGALFQFFRWSGSKDPNASSMICKITFGKRSVFLLADTTGEAQKALATERKDIPWKADFIKAGHHGYTRQDDKLLKLIDPEFCVITNTAASAQKSVQQMASRGIPAMITNKGTVYVHTDGGENWYYMQDKTHAK